MWNILVVDNDTKSAESLKTSVEALGRPFRVEKTFENGEVAYRYLCENPSKIDILITDICISGFSGLELIRKIKNAGWCISCIVLSSYKVFEYAQRAMELNVVRYLLKPLERELLLDVLDSIDLKRRQEFEEGERDLSREIFWLKREIERDYRDFDMDARAAALGYTKEHLYRVFKREMGITVAGYLQEVRLKEARRIMTDTRKYKIYEISEMVGYKDHIHFTKLFKKKYQLTPKEFQKYEQNDEETS